MTVAVGGSSLQSISPTGGEERANDEVEEEKN